MGTGYTKMKIIEEPLQLSLFIGNSSEWTIRHTCFKENLAEKVVGRTIWNMASAFCCQTIDLF